MTTRIARCSVRGNRRCGPTSYPWRKRGGCNCRWSERTSCRADSLTRARGRASITIMCPTCVLDSRLGTCSVETFGKTPVCRHNDQVQRAGREDFEDRETVDPGSAGTACYAAFFWFSLRWDWWL